MGRRIRIAVLSWLESVARKAHAAAWWCVDKTWDLFHAAGDKRKAAQDVKPVAEKVSPFLDAKDVHELRAVIERRRPRPVSEAMREEARAAERMRWN